MKQINTFTNLSLLIGVAGPLLLTLALTLLYLDEEQAILGTAITGSFAIIFAVIGRHQTLRNRQNSLMAAWIALTIGLLNFFPIFLLSFGFVLLPLGILLILSFGTSSFLWVK